MKETYNNLVSLRRKGIIYRFISIVADYELFEIYIWSDSGRIMRPIYIVNNGNKLNIDSTVQDGLKSGKYNWDKLIQDNIIEYLSIHEIKYNSLIADSEYKLNRDPILYKYTHCEISPLCILSINTMSMPHSNTNPGPRQVFQNSMGKQAAGIYADNHHVRMDTTAIVFPSAQLPIVPTLANKYTGEIEYPNGLNAIVAVAPYLGYNIEDSIMVNQRSIDNGFMDVFVLKVIIDKAESGNEQFMKPKPEETQYYNHDSSYHAIDDHGYPIKGKIVAKGDIIIGKVKIFSKGETNKRLNKQFKYSDKSKKYNEMNPGEIVRVSIHQGNDENNIIKVKIRIFRKLKIGDKLASQSAQKSTVSMTLKPEDMPFTEDGEMIDIIFNPHSLITRMTQSQLIAQAQSIIGVSKGVRIDGTPFNVIKIRDNIIKELESLGFKNHGDKIMYNGRTGHKMKAKIFVGPIYYQRLKQMIDDKVSARGLDGFYNPNTKQPNKGRKRKGGFRLGYMENDAMMANGTAHVLKEKFYDHSDKFVAYISKDTGYFCVGNKHKNIYEDGVENKNIVEVRTPWMLLYFWYLIMTTGISMKFNVE